MTRARVAAVVARATPMVVTMVAVAMGTEGVAREAVRGWGRAVVRVTGMVVVPVRRRAAVMVMVAAVTVTERKAGTEGCGVH